MAKKYIYHDEYSKLPATAIQAKMIGETYYYTGKVCSRNHISRRYASSGNCVQCIEEKRGRIQPTRGKSSTRSEINLERAIKAIDKGETIYESTKPCPQGHLTRYVTTNNCVECSNLSLQKRRLESKWRRYRSLYGLDQSGYEAMLLAQFNLCAICKIELTGKNTHVDHCHSTGKVRALLCSRCNQGIGLFDENIEKLNKVISYLERHRHA